MAARRPRSLIGRMGRDQRIIDELRAFERLCIELAADATMPEERAGLEIMAGNYRAAILDAGAGNAFCRHGADTGVSREILDLA